MALAKAISKDYSGCLRGAHLCARVNVFVQIHRSATKRIPSNARASPADAHLQLGLIAQLEFNFELHAVRDLRDHWTAFDVDAHLVVTRQLVGDLPKPLSGLLTRHRLLGLVFKQFISHGVIPAHAGVTPPAWQ